MRPSNETTPGNTGFFDRLWKSFVATQTSQANERINRYRRTLS